MIPKFLGLLAGAIFLASSLSAQTTTTTGAAPTTAETTGTIKEYTPGVALVLETLSPNAPIQFKLSKNITYSDADGKIIESAGLTTNQKVRVHYSKIDGDNLADKVTIIGN